MRQIDHTVHKLCWDYVSNVGKGNNPYITQIYQKDVSSFICFKEGADTHSRKGYVGLVLVNSNLVVIDPKGDERFRSYLTKELTKRYIKSKVIDLLAEKNT